MSNGNDKRRSYSAGILPYTIRDKRIYYLLGRDWRDEGWSDFGGKVEDKDNHDIVTTAIREFFEETMGVVLSLQELENKLNDNKVFIKSQTLNGSPYYMYFVYVNDEDYQKYFQKTAEFVQYIKFNEAKYMEKCEMMWVASDNTLNTNIKLRNIFRKTLLRCEQHIHDIEKEILRENA